MTPNTISDASAPSRSPPWNRLSPTKRVEPNEINVARECATTCSSVRQCHLDPGCREKAITCQLYRLGHGGQPPMICRNVQKCKERCVELKPAPALTGPYHKKATLNQP